MKLIYCVAFLFGLTGSLHGYAQNAAPGDKPDKLWLQNSDKQTLTLDNDSVSRAFFEAKSVMILCSRRALPNEQFFCAIQPSGNKPAMVFMLENRMLSPEALKQIKAADSGSSIVFVLQPKSGSRPLLAWQNPRLRLFLK